MANEYLSIGEFSKLSGLSIKALRYYDKKGILKPKYISDETSYRYYSRNQLGVTNVILTSIMLDIKLSYVKENFITNESINYDSYLKYAKNNLKSRIDELKANLSLVEEMSICLERQKKESYHVFTPFKKKKARYLLSPFNNSIDSFEYDKAIADIFNLYQKEEKEFEYTYGVMRYENQNYIFVEINNPKFIKKKENHFIITLNEDEYEAKLSTNLKKEELTDSFYIITESYLDSDDIIYEIIKKREER